MARTCGRLHSFSIATCSPSLNPERPLFEVIEIYLYKSVYHGAIVSSIQKNVGLSSISLQHMSGK